MGLLETLWSLPVSSPPKLEGQFPYLVKDRGPCLASSSPDPYCSSATFAIVCVIVYYVCLGVWSHSKNEADLELTI